MEFDWKTFEKVVVETNFPIASDSPDYLMPWGTARDNSTNHRFNRKCIKLFQHQTALKILDLGCSGGGFVKECVDLGCLAVGLEGSDYSKRLMRAHWPLLEGKLLFTADITKPFSIKSQHVKGSHPLSFNLITMWEVLEHLKEEEVIQALENVKRHLDNRGLLIISVSTREEIIKGVKLHQTVKPLTWWINLFADNGFYRMREIEDYFDQDYVRGPHNAEGSINCVFATNPEEVPIPPSQEKKRKFKLKNLFRKRGANR